MGARSRSRLWVVVAVVVAVVVVVVTISLNGLFINIKEVSKRVLLMIAS